MKTAEEVIAEVILEHGRKLHVTSRALAMLIIGALMDHSLVIVHVDRIKEPGQ